MIAKSDISKYRCKQFAFIEAKELINSLKSSEHGDFEHGSSFGQLTRYTFGNGAKAPDGATMQVGYSVRLVHKYLTFQNHIFFKKNTFFAFFFASVKNNNYLCR